MPFAWLPKPVCVIKHPFDPVKDRIEWAWLELYRERCVETAPGNWAGGMRYYLEREPLGNETRKAERWRSEERGD